MVLLYTSAKISISKQESKIYSILIPNFSDECKTHSDDLVNEYVLHKKGTCD